MTISHDVPKLQPHPVKFDSQGAWLDPKSYQNCWVDALGVKWQIFNPMARIVLPLYKYFSKPIIYLYLRIQIQIKARTNQLRYLKHKNTEN